MSDAPQQIGTPEELAEQEAAALARLVAERARKALRDAPEIGQHVRSLALSGAAERGETFPELSAPMRITAADDVDALYAQLVTWVTFWARLTEFIPHTMAVAWANLDGPLGFRAGTAPERAGLLVKLQTYWLDDHHDQISVHPSAGVYFDDVAQIIWSLKARYPMRASKPRDVSPRPCLICGEPEVGAVWTSEHVLDVEVRCGHCGEAYPSTPAQVLKWLVVDEPVLAISEACEVWRHRACTSIQCDCSCHKWTYVVPPIPEGLCGINGCVFLAGHTQRAHSWKAAT